jgi:hypothetical protein
VCSIEDFVAGKDPYRAAPFGLIPTPYPFVEGVCTQKGADAHQAVEAQYMKVLDSYSITYSSIRFHSLWRKCYPADAVDTLIVETKDVTVSKWIEATSIILGLFYTAGLQPGEIKVEICNPFKMYHDESTCLPDNKELLGAMREVEPRVLQVVRKELPGIWTSIAYHMRGPTEDASNRKPTVVVTCLPESRHFFEKIESLISAVLASENYPQVSLHLELIPGRVELALPPSPNQDSKARTQMNLSNRPENGASICVQSRRLDAGTLGGWVTLHARSDRSKTMKCAMTCYHVIEKGDLANINTNDEKGIGLSGNKVLSPIRILWPATFDVMATKKRIQAIIQAPTSTPRNRQTNVNYLNHINGLEAAGPIGEVRFASGHRRTNENRRLDWALIASPSTHSQNKPPPSKAFEEVQDFEKSLTYYTDKDDIISGFGTMKEDDWVAKTGRSGTSAGYVNKIRRRVCWESVKQKESYETEVIGLAGDFAYGGDSGSWVVNDRHELVGLLIGIEREANKHGMGFVTPIQAIIDDVKLKVGADMSLP